MDHPCLFQVRDSGSPTRGMPCGCSDIVANIGSMPCQPPETIFSGEGGSCGMRLAPVMRVVSSNENERMFNARGKEGGVSCHEGY